MTGVKVAVINATALLSDAQVDRAVADIWASVRRGAAPEWGAEADLVFVPRGSALPPCTWALVVMDDVAQAGNLVNAESLAASTH